MSRMSVAPQPQTPVPPVDPTPRVGEDSRASLEANASFAKRQSLHEQRLASMPSPKGVGGNIDCFC